MTLQQFFLVLRARFLVVIGVAIAVIAAAVALSLVLPKKYSASASIVVDIAPDPVMGGGLQPGGLAQSYIATQIDIINSERVAERVAKALKLDESEKFHDAWLKQTEGAGSFKAWLAQMLLKNLDAKPSRDSNVINITVTWPDGKAAAQLADAFAQAYIDTTLEIKVEPAKQYAAWFEVRTKALREDLAAAQKRLSDYQTSHGIIAADERLDVENARLAELSSQLVAIQALRSESTSREAHASGRMQSSPDVLQNPIVQSLRAEIARSEARLKDLGGQFGKNHPQYQRAEAELAELKVKLDSEMRQVASTVGTSNSVNVEREAQLKSALDAQKRRLLEVKKQRDEVTGLQNDVLIAQRNLDQISQRLAQKSLESQTQLTNIVQLAHATEPLVASSPKIMLNVIMSVVVGFMLGIGAALVLEMLDQRVRGANDLKVLLGVPVLGVVATAGAKRTKKSAKQRVVQLEPVHAK